MSPFAIKQKPMGSVLIILLMLLSFMMVPVWLLSRQELILSQQIHAYILHNHIKLVSNNVLKQLEAKCLPNNRCNQIMISDVDLIHKSHRWWQHETCSGFINGFEYYYFFEKLDAESGHDGQLWRITLLTRAHESQILVRSVITCSKQTEPYKQAAQRSWKRIL